MENMIEKLNGYTKYFGPDIEGDIRLIEGHQHTRVKRSDGVVSPETAVDRAEELGIDLVITDHNTMEGVERALTRKFNSGYSLEIVPAVEYTARDSIGNHRHLIALNSQELVPPALHYKKANVLFHRQGASVIAAHPELGTYSMHHQEIKDIEDPEEGFDGLEIYNGGGAKAYQAAQQGFMRHISPYLQALPSQDLNNYSRQIYERNGHNLFPYGGSDGHTAKEIGDVVMVRPREVAPVEAIKTGQIAIYVRNESSHISHTDYLKKLAINIIDKI